ncbi:MAG: calcium/sodium antiporter [Propioniciclava sp.]|uniref:calcium/sodium antiporter n=1 Tax=Propioniciclava sp. TaxID=2038686 RepID=UPI0039E5E8AC
MHALPELIAGLLALIAGAELVVRYGSLLAARMGVPPMVIGLTIVSIGTSAPELAVGIDAMHVNAGSLAVGNIAGTNIVNLLLILGLSAAVRSIPFGRRTKLLDLPAMALAAVLVLVFSLDGQLQFWEGIPLLLGAILYTAALGWWMWKQKAEMAVSDIVDDAEPEPDRPSPLSKAWWYVVLLIAGIVVIVVGADWLVQGAVAMAREFGVSDAFIGLTVVAIGTSAPELVTTIVATARGDRDIAIGNLIGSSTYNLTLILGVPVLVAHGSGPIDPHLLRFDLPVMTAVALLCFPLFVVGQRLSRREGALMVIGYAAYLTYLISTRG